MKKTNKLPMTTILVVTGDQVLPTGNFATATTALNLADGQLGVLSFDPNSAVRPLGQYVRTGDDATEVQAIKLVQGTPLSQSLQNVTPWEVADKSHVESGVIRRNNIRSVYVKKPNYATLGAQSVTTFPTPTNDAEYFAYLQLQSTRMEKEYGITNKNILYASSPVADFTALGTTSPLDYVLSHIVSDFNSQSKAVTSTTHKGKQPFVVFGVKVGGGSGQALGTITSTTSIPFITVDGETQSLTSSVELQQALAQLVVDSALTASSTIENVDVTVAGAAAKIDALIVVGLPETLAAYYDNVQQQMVRPQINLGGSFITGTDPIVTTCYPQEGTGHTRKWDLENRRRNQLNVHTMQIQPKDDWFSEGVSYINPAKSFYTSYIVEYFDTENTLTLEVQSPKKVTLLFRGEPDAEETFATVTDLVALGSPYKVPFVTSDDAGTGTASAVTVPAVENVLTAWLESARTTGTNFAVGGDATAGGTYLS